MTTLQERIDAFEVHLEQGGIIGDESQRIHQEFKKGQHGIKVDFGHAAIAEGTALFSEWVDVTHDYIEGEYRQLPDGLVRVDSGTNALVGAVIKKFGTHVLDIATEKKPDIGLTHAARKIITHERPNFLLVLDDVGTTGSTTRSVVDQIERLGVPRVEVLYALQRTVSLPYLARVAVQSMIRRPMPTYEPEQCRYCHEGYELIEYKWPRQTA